MKDFKTEKLAYINRVITHNRIVVDLMVLLEINREKLPFEIEEWSLIRRAMQHDTDKFETNYANITVSMYVDELNDDDVEEINKRKAKCHDHHKVNSHHFTYHIDKKTEPSSIDICEICCDCVASAQKKKYIERFNGEINIDKVKEIFLESYNNTIKEMKIEHLIEKFIMVFDLLKEVVESKK